MGRVWGMSTKQSGAHDRGHTEVHGSVSHLLWAPPAPGVGLKLPSPLYSLASPSPSPLSPQPHPGAPGAPSMGPDSCSHLSGMAVLSRDWIPCTHCVLFCPTFYLKISNSSFFGGRGSIVQGTVYTLPGRMRVPGGALCPILPESGRPLFPGTWPRTAVHPWTMLWSDVYSYSVARPHSYVLGDCLF